MLAPSLGREGFGDIFVGNEKIFILRKEAVVKSGMVPKNQRPKATPAEVHSIRKRGECSWRIHIALMLIITVFCTSTSFWRVLTPRIYERSHVTRISVSVYHITRCVTHNTSIFYLEGLLEGGLLLQWTWVLAESWLWVNSCENTRIAEDVGVVNSRPKV